MSRFILAWIVLILTLSQLHAQDAKWKTYVNGRFGFSLSYPHSLIPTTPDAVDGAGREYHTPDQEFSIVGEAHFMSLLGDHATLTSVWRDELKDDKGLITYQKKGKSWYVVSGITTNGYVFYNKFFTQGKNWAAFQITYPRTQKQKYDPWVVRIEKSFVPFVKGKKGQYDRGGSEGWTLPLPLPLYPAPPASPGSATTAREFRSSLFTTFDPVLPVDLPHRARTMTLMFSETFGQDESMEIWACETRET